MKIRQATLDDTSAVAALTIAAYQGYFSLLGRNPTPMHQDHPARIAKGEVFVAIDDDICGVIVLEDRCTETLIYSVAVAPERRSLGLGRALLAFAETQARGNGHRNVRLCTSDKMHRNLAIYTAFGYSEVSREDLDLAQSPTVVWMVKNL